MATPTEEQVLTLAQWFSPGFPVGAFAYSHGLEWAIEAGEVTICNQLEDWIKTVLCHGSGRADALILAATYQAGTQGEVAEIDALCRAFAASGERLRETVLQGAAFCDTITAISAVELSDLSYPVAVGRAAGLSGLPAVPTAQMYLFAFMSNLVTVGMRLVPLGQTEGQRLIRKLTPLCAEIAWDTKMGDLDGLNATSFIADIASMKHETQYSRVFRT